MVCVAIVLVRSVSGAYTMFCVLLPSSYSVDYPESVHSGWTAAQDAALVHYVDGLCQRLAVGASLLQPWDVCISEQDTISEEFTSLQGRCYHISCSST